MGCLYKIVAGSCHDVIIDRLVLLGLLLLYSFDFMKKWSVRFFWLVFHIDYHYKCT